MCQEFRASHRTTELLRRFYTSWHYYIDAFSCARSYAKQLLQYQRVLIFPFSPSFCARVKITFPASELQPTNDAKMTLPSA